MFISEQPHLSVVMRTREPGPDRDAPTWAWLLAGLLMLVAVATGLLGSPYLDPIRDVYWAHRIASGQALPLVGPEIGFFTHLGPLWFYLLAPALWLNSSLATVAAWAGLLQGLQFPLALALGQRLGHWRLGLYLALLLCLPSLSSFSSLSFNHFNLVPAALIGLLLAAFHDQARKSLVSASMVGLVFSLLVHAHPATLALAWIPAWLLLEDRRSLLQRGSAMAFAFILPFLPLALQASTQGLPATPTGSASAHLAEHLSWSAALDTPRLVGHVLVDGFHHGLVLSTQGWPALAWPLGAAAAALLLLSLAGLPTAWRHRRLRGLLIVALAGVVMQSLGALLMRSEVLWYMMLAVPTLAMVIAAIGLSQLPDRLALVPGTLIGLCASLALLGSLLATSDDNGQRHFPAAFMMNLMAGGAAGTSHAGPQLSFHGSDRLARWLCAGTQPRHLHGALAQQADTLTDLVFDLYCPRQRPDVRIMGSSSSAQGVFALSPALARALPFPARETLEALHFFPIAAVHHPVQAIPLAHAGDYPPRARSLAGSELREIEFGTAPGRWLIISNPFPWWAEMSVVEVRANQHLLTALATDTVSQIFYCAQCSPEQTIDWQVRYRSPEHLQPDIISLDTPDQFAAVP